MMNRQRAKSGHAENLACRQEAAPNGMALQRFTQAMRLNRADEHVGRLGTLFLAFDLFR